MLKTMWKVLRAMLKRGNCFLRFDGFVKNSRDFCSFHTKREVKVLHILNYKLYIICVKAYF